MRVDKASLNPSTLNLMIINLQLTVHLLVHFFYHCPVIQEFVVRYIVERFRQVQVQSVGILLSIMVE